MRKTERVTLDASAGRDAGKTFIVTELDSWHAIKWCARAMLALAQSGTNVPPGALAKAADGGPETLAALGLQIFALIPEATALPLMDDVRGCVTYQPPTAAVAAQPIYDGAMCQIEEPTTWYKLMQRVFAVHLGFLPAATPPTTG
jgi:hypothetical protein